MIQKNRAIISAILLLSFLVASCTQADREEDGITILVFKHGKIAGDPEPFNRLLERFEKENPGIKIKDEILPASTDEQHQFYVINLEGRSSDFDILSMDVIWIPEFARAGWLRDISHLLPLDTQRARRALRGRLHPALPVEGATQAPIIDERDDFFSGPMDAVTFDGRIYAIPWYIDAGLLYYRKDLLEKYGFSPPKTWYELVEQASLIMKYEPGIYGFIWQGKQYEGLICNVLEYIWGNGGDVLKDEKVIIDSPENREALLFMRDLIYKQRITPEFVTTSTEEPTRHIFGKGKALFMRNWPYAWNIFSRDGSPIKGKVGVTTLPSFPGHESAATLGGWQLGINRYSKYPEEAGKFVKFLTSYDVQKYTALTIGYKPTRKALYKDKDLIEAQPFIVSLYKIFETARPRHVTPYYMMFSQVMQPEFSSVLSMIKEPQEALSSARRQLEFILNKRKERDDLQG